MLQLNQVGAQPQNAAQPYRVRFGIYLPGITRAQGFSLKVRVINEEDQFVAGIAPVDFPLDWIGNNPYDLWQGDATLTPGQGNFGDAGRYIYRYQLSKNGQVVVPWFADPFANESAPGTFSGFTVPQAAPFPWKDANFRVPGVDDLIVYELNVEEFNYTFDGIVDRLDYLQGLGVNVMELMPITFVGTPFDWGYMPESYFSPLQKYGGVAGLKNLVNEAHQRGIAVILDSVYDHCSDNFPYASVYNSTGLPSPMMGFFVASLYGNDIDFNKPFTRDYFNAVNQHWIDQFHIDGFRYDYVPGYYDGPAGNGYAQLVFNTYQYSRSGTIPRFFKAGDPYSRIIQVAEDLDDPKGILAQTYTTCTWQDGLLNEAAATAQNNRLNGDNLPHLLDPGFMGYPGQFKNPSPPGDQFPNAPFQYLESHDHSRLITRVALSGDKDASNQPLGDRSKWFKLQPYAIALYTCQGVPMLWQGQELVENYSVAAEGDARIEFARSLQWDFFYDSYGNQMVNLYRRLATLRQSLPALRGRSSFYYNQYSDTSRGVIIYSRATAGQTAIVFLNFSDADQAVQFPFAAGQWNEMLTLGKFPNMTGTGNPQAVTVPSNYGLVYLQ